VLIIIKKKLKKIQNDFLNSKKLDDFIVVANPSDHFINMKPIAVGYVNSVLIFLCDIFRA